MKVDKEITVVLENFEGPLELLFHLVYKCEIDIYEVMLKKITNEFLALIKERSTPIDKSAEFLLTAASLVWYKSQQLVPKHTTEPLPENLLEDPHFEVIHHLVDYCRFKHAAKELVVRENEQSVFHPRVAAKAKRENGQLHEEAWKVSDKIAYLRKILTLQENIGFFELFSGELSRLEMIVIFLAVLELMKLGEITVIRELSSNEIIIHPLQRDR